MGRWCFAVLLLAACGSGEPVHVTAHGMAVYLESERLPKDRDWTPLEAALTIAVDVLSEHVPRAKLEAMLGESELHLYSGKVSCAGGLKWGCYSEGGVFESVGWTDCPTEWILHHELVHMAQEVDGREQSHRHPMFGDDSWETQLGDAMKAELRVCDKVPIY